MTTQDALDYFGSYAEIARALKITRSATAQWGEYPPLLRQYQLAEIMGNNISLNKIKDSI